MNVPGIIGKKIQQKQAFLDNGHRVPLTVVSTQGNVIIQIKSQDRDGYHAVQMGFATRKNPTKALVGHSKKAGIDYTPRFFREIRVDKALDETAGTRVVAADIFEPGDLINVTGTSKGKGFAGAVKRHNFRGGPRTHGQSDRERAPGSIGQTTTPGRVYKGKRMAGHMGVDTVTVKNLQIIEINGDLMLVKGLVPGPLGSTLSIVKVGKKDKRYAPLFKKVVEEPQVEEVEGTIETVVEEPSEEKVAEVEAAQDEAVAEAPAQESETSAEKPENKEEVQEEKEEK